LRRAFDAAAFLCLGLLVDLFSFVKPDVSQVLLPPSKTLGTVKTQNCQSAPDMAKHPAAKLPGGVAIDSVKIYNQWVNMYLHCAYDKQKKRYGRNSRWDG
jgi:hypothetical protein